jgi:cell wall-associated NlpC family hydrolase
MRFFVLPASLLFAVAVHAAPQQDKTDDELARMLADKGLIGQLKQVRQTVTERTSDLVVTAMGFLGVPYRRGGNTAESGFDCSGFVKRHVQPDGRPHAAPPRRGAGSGHREDRRQQDLKPGDLVFFNTMRRAFSHVGIYVGEGKFIHSPRPAPRFAWRHERQLLAAPLRRRAPRAGGPADEARPQPWPTARSTAATEPLPDPNEKNP